MRTAKYQRGQGIWFVLFILLVIGFVTFTALKLFPVYMEDFSISAAMQSIEEDHLVEYKGQGSVIAAISKRLSISDVKVIRADDIEVEQERGEFIATINYEVEVPYIGNLFLLMKFNHQATVKAAGW